MIGEEQKLVFYEIAVGSILLVWINVIFIYFTAVMVFKIKKVGEFQLIRRIDEDAWKNLPRVQRSPTSVPRQSRHLDRTSSTNSTDELLERERMDGAAPNEMADNGDDHPLSPLRRRPRPPNLFVPDDADSDDREHIQSV